MNQQKLTSIIYIQSRVERDSNMNKKAKRRAIKDALTRGGLSISGEIIEVKSHLRRVPGRKRKVRVKAHVRMVQ